MGKKHKMLSIWQNLPCVFTVWGQVKWLERPSAREPSSDVAIFPKANLQAHWVWRHPRDGSHGVDKCVIGQKWCQPSWRAASGSAQLCCLLCLNIQRQTAPVWATRTTHKAGCVLISAQCWALQGVWQREPKVPQKQPGRIRWKMPAPARCLPEGMHRNCPPCFCMLLYKTCFVCAFFVCLFLLGLFDMQLPKSLWQYPWKKKVIGIMSPFKLALVAEVRWATLLCALNEMKGNRVESDNSNNSVFPFSPSLWKGLQDPVCSSGSPELLPNFSAFCLKLRRETIAQPSRLLIAIFPELTLIQFCISMACYWVQASVTVVLSPPGLCPPCSGFLPWIIKTHNSTVLPRSSKG